MDEFLCHVHFWTSSHDSWLFLLVHRYAGQESLDVSIQGFWCQCDLAAYVLHSALSFIFKLNLGSAAAEWSLNSAFMDGLTGLGLAPKFVSLLWALAYTGFIYIPVYIMYRRKIFLKV